MDRETRRLQRNYLFNQKDHIGVGPTSLEEESEDRTNTIKTQTCFMTKMRVMVEDLTENKLVLISIRTNGDAID